MSIQDERAIRDHLRGVLDGVQPRPAPVAATVRQGRRIRIRRTVGVTALALVAVLAAVLPQVLPGQPQSAVPLVPRHYSVNVGWPGQIARGGVLAEGVTDGKRWRVVASGSAASPVITAEGVSGPGLEVESTTPAGDPAALASLTNPPGPKAFSMLYGTVGSDVTTITVRLPDGESADLIPVEWGGSRWVGLVLPAGVPIVRAVAYAGVRELAYAVPFRQLELNVWWPPGHAGPARVTRSIGSGVIDGHRWSATARIGPWGYCYTLGSSAACLDGTSGPQLSGQPVSVMTCSRGASKLVTLGVAVAAPSVQRVVLRLSNGKSASFATVKVAGSRVFAFAIPAHVHATGSREYGPAGRVVGSTTGAMWGC